MGIVSLVFQIVKSGKRGVALVGLIAVYVLNKYFGVVTTETEVVNQISLVLGAVGVVHGVWKSELVQKIVAGIKAKSAETNQPKA